jgi:hypothetical protein
MRGNLFNAAVNSFLGEPKTISNLSDGIELADATISSSSCNNGVTIRADTQSV